MTVSVVIPCYNAEAYLAQAIGSVLEQRRPAHEVVVVDDGSTDGSLALARRFEARFPDRVRVVTERSGRASKTRNVGAAHATGKALLFLDADDVLGPDVLEALTDALGRQGEGVAIGPWYRLERVEGRWVKRAPSCAPRRAGQDALGAWLTGWYHPPCAVLWSKAAFERAGRWDERWNPNDDGDLVMRALAYGVPLAEATRGASFYRRLPESEGSLSGARFTRKGIEARLLTIRKIAYLLEERGRLRPYRAPLSEAFRLVAADAHGRHGDLHEEALAAARRYRPDVRVRAQQAGRGTAASLRRPARRLYHGLRRRLKAPPPVQRTSAEALEEVRFGLDVAGDVLRAPARTSAQTSGLASGGRPAVTVIIPTYNRAGLLPRALGSVLAQTFGDFEVLVVDDGSTDGTADVLAGYDDVRIRYLRQAQNRGVSAARNRGLREARGELVAFLDSDDVWFPDKLALQVERFGELPESVGLLYGGVENDDGRGGRDVRVPTRRGGLYGDLLLTNPIHGTSGVMVRRNVVAAVGFFDEAAPAIEDYDYWLRIARLFEVDFVEEPLIRYHDPRDVRRMSLDVRANRAARAWLYGKHGRAMRRAGVAHRFLQESARRSLVPPEARDRRRARRLLAQAILARPQDPKAYTALLRATLPRRVLGPLRAAWGRLRRG